MRLVVAPCRCPLIAAAFCHSALSSNMAGSRTRNAKRRKLDTAKPEPAGVEPSESGDSSATTKLLSPAVLLVSLPGLLAHPPNHKYYVPSLMLSLAALRKCLTLSALSPEIECRAWTGLAEIGMKVISGGLSQSEDHPWADGIESEVRVLRTLGWQPSNCVIGGESPWKRCK